MSKQQAQSAVTLSAFVVAAVFAYRKLTEPATGGKRVPATSHFVVGFGFTFIMLSLVAQAAPQLGGMGAVLVATGDLLSNGQALVKDLQDALDAQAASASGTAASSPTSRASGDTATGRPIDPSRPPVTLIQPGTSTRPPIQLIP
jgi:hypothetical protein